MIVKDGTMYLSAASTALTARWFVPHASARQQRTWSLLMATIANAGSLGNHVLTSHILIYMVVALDSQPHQDTVNGLYISSERGGIISAHRDVPDVVAA